MSITYRTLGELTVTSSGNNLDGRQKPILLTLIAACDNESLCWNSDGEMDEAHAWLEARFDPQAWYETPDSGDEPHADLAIAAAVNQAFAAKNLDGTVTWSDEGMQETGVAYFDIEIKLVEQIWPEYKLAALRGPRI
jgi:hypothetical protein